MLNFIQILSNKFQTLSDSLKYLKFAGSLVVFKNNLSFFESFITYNESTDFDFFDVDKSKSLDFKSFKQDSLTISIEF